MSDPIQSKYAETQIVDGIKVTARLLWISPMEVDLAGVNFFALNITAQNVETKKYLLDKDFILKDVLSSQAIRFAINEFDNCVKFYAGETDTTTESIISSMRN